MAYLQHIINLFCGNFHLHHHVDGSDDLFSQSPKRARKPSAKKDALEDLFDNDTDEFLDQVGKEKNGPADDAPVDMVSMYLLSAGYGYIGSSFTHYVIYM